MPQRLFPIVPILNSLRSRKVLLPFWPPRGLVVTCCLWSLGLTPVLSSLMVPRPTIAYEAQLTITLDQEPNESFETLTNRAEVVARAAVQRSFDTDILATDVLVFVNARRGGLEAPLLSVQIGRFQWNNRPDTRYWATYYASTRSLLGLDRPQVSPTDAPVDNSVTPDLPVTNP